MMDDRQREFRHQYQAQISPWYNGYVHVSVMYAVGLAVIGWCLLHLQSATWEWLLVVPVFAVSNGFEWWMHKFVMHRLVDRYALRAIYDRHTRQHHQYFTHQEMTVNSAREFRIVFFPWRALVTFMALGVPFALLLGWLIKPAAAYILMVTIVGQYLIYETFHYSCHVPENRWLRHLPCVNTIRRHHAAHHHHGLMMERNMNLTFPIADWFMGTSDLNRSLLGHLFNGYSERWIKPECRSARERASGEVERATARD